MIYSQEGRWQRNCDLEIKQQSRSIRAKTPSPEWIGATTLSKDWVNSDLSLTKEVQHYKQMSVVKSLSKARRTLPRMWLQPTEEIAKHIKGNDDKEAIIINKLKSHLKGLI